MRDLKGLTIIMTGGTGGMGTATALRIAEPGVNIGICSVDREGLTRLEEQLTAKGASVYAQYVDVTDPAAIRAFMDACVDKFGKVDILLNLAGLSITASLAQLDEAGYDTVMDVNLKGTFFATQAFADHVDPDSGALVINIGSMASKRPSGGNVHYSAVKAAVNTMTQALAQQLKSKNIRFTVLNPGPTDTAFYAGRIAPEKRVEFMQADDVAEVIEFVMKRSDRLVFHDLMFDSFGYFKK